MAVNPKNVQKSVRLAVALANPDLRDQDWSSIKEKFQVDDNTINGIKELISVCKENNNVKQVISDLTYNC